MQRNVNDIPEGFGKLGALALDKHISVLEPSAPIVINECESLREAIETMQDFRIGCAVVVNKDGKISGMLSERDILMKWALSENSADTVQIADIMTSDPEVVFAEDTIAGALYRMSTRGFRHLPVVDSEGYPTGVISVKDIVDFISIEFMRSLVAPSTKA